MEKVNAAVVGVGIYGKHHLNAYSYNPKVNLLAFCERNSELREKTTRETGLPGYATLDELFAQHPIDIVSIATPDPWHFEPTAQAIAAGKHVLIEKPMATSVAECEEIIRLAARAGVKVGIDYHKRWDGMAQHIHNELKKPETGQVLRGYMSMDDVIDVPRNWLKWANISSPIYFLGSHCFDLIRYYMNGANALTVYAIGQKKLLQAEGIDTWDTIQCFVTFDNGAQWTVETGWCLPDAFPKANDGRSFVITEKKYFRADAQYRGYEIFGETRNATPNYNFINYINNVATGYGIQPVNDFVDHVLDDVPFLATAEDGLQSARICEAVHRSLECGLAVNL
ncbi:Gfo/Idh/MocA family oxidoreductase [Paramixta manurensis]|uniref:Gfo/Idh/MocA family oxidoreductase n=1 Tax=Paramixta manurensis TaxID=2740817 RepID=A0A6M8UKX0_9GAMM|nr:Gfo/Idh/MocA family oxidoreductase [Erwiniaceae bacterium PD-1]